MTVILPSKKWPWWVIVLAVAGGLFLALAVVLDFELHAVENQRINNLHTSIANTRTTDQAAYKSLLDKYSAVYAQLAATGAKSNQTKPADIPPLPGPVGPAGTAGAKGETGTTGNGIISASCNSDGSWAFLYTNGNTQTISGPCLGAQGPAGAPGPVGGTGATGPAGANGLPPTSWTYTGAFGIQHTCSQNSPFDPSSPTYTCN